MFVYLSKKIAIPNGVKLKSLSWNGINGWIVCGGEDGLLKVLKLDSAQQAEKAKNSGAPSNLSMNQTLEGHNGSVVCVCWNENYRKLTTSDQNGMIIVWMLHKGMWYEEMINNRNKSNVRGMRWTPDGQRICIIYEDGAVIVGSVDGNRLWGKEIKTELAHVEWSPDGRNILFCTRACEVHIYDSIGNFVSKLPLYCLEDAAAATSLVGIEWYDGSEGLFSLDQPVLAIGFENGRLQLMRNEADTSPVLVDAGMSLSCMRWNSDGSVLAVAGTLSTKSSSGERRDVCMVQFYAPSGQHMRTLKVPGSTMSALSWEGGSLRVALAVDSFIYFANIRPNYRCGFLGDTLVYSFTTPERHDSALLFWNTKTDERVTKLLSKPLVAVHAAADCCVYATQADDADNQHVLRLCSANGSPIDQKYIDFEPAFLTLTQYHVVAASADAVYVWQYRTLTNKLTSVDAGTGSLRRKEGRERCWHIDDELRASSEPVAMVAGREASQDPIIALAASSACMLVARESGALLRFSLPHIGLEHKYTLRGRTQSIGINCDSTRISLIDANGLLTLFDLEMAKGAGGEVRLPPAEPDQPPARFERKDVWQVLWAEDNAQLFAVMEKSRMLLFRELVPDEPVVTSGYLCSFSDLEVRAVLLDEVMREPEHPSKKMLQAHQARALREAQEHLRESNLADAFGFVEANPHPRLWRLVAEAALHKLDFGVADKSFVRAEDYMGIHLVKRLRLLDDAKKQAAEVAAYFSQFDEAEKIYRELDRRDLALQLRANLGDWTKVVQLVQQGGGDDTKLRNAWDRIGDQFLEQSELDKAAGYYAQAQNMPALADCLYRSEAYAGLVKLAADLPDGTPLLVDIGHKLSSVGMSADAVDAFVKGGDVHAAIDSCLMQHKFEGAVELAEKHNFPGVQKALAQFAGQLIDSGKKLQAVELYSKASQFTEAAKLLTRIAADVGASRSNPQRAKKLFVAAALEVERMRKQMLDSKAPQGGTQTAAQTLESLVTQDKATGGDKWLDSAWRGAEAYHFLLLAQRQLYSGKTLDAMRTALRLREYETVLPKEEIYSLIALTAFYAKFYGQCSRAFVKLQAAGCAEAKHAEISKLALSIFTRFSPVDPSQKRADCPSCGGNVKEWDAHCAGCGQHLPACTLTGKAILEPHLTAKCRVCKHSFYETEAHGLQNCPLCHSQLPLQLHAGY